MFLISRHFNRGFIYFQFENNDFYSDTENTLWVLSWLRFNKSTKW